MILSWKKREPWICLILAAIFEFFSSGQWMIPVAVWFAPVFMIRFLRNQSFFFGFIAFFLVTYLSMILNPKGGLPFTGMKFYGFCALMVLLNYVPYHVDRRLISHFQNVWGTLIFPCAFVVYEYINTHIPHGKWVSIASTQENFIWLIQIASLTGIWGILFVISWFASIVNWMWKNRFVWSTIRLGAGIYAIVFITVLVFGWICVQYFPAERLSTLSTLDIQRGRWFAIASLIVFHLFIFTGIWIKYKQKRGEVN